MNGKLIVFMQEPEDYKVNSAQLKSLSGNDRHYSRELYEKARYMDINALIVIVSNGALDLSRCDEAALSRMVVIPFTSTFITSRMAHRYSTDVDDEKVHVADKDLDARFPTLAPYFFYMLTLFFAEYQQQGLVIPPAIRQYTDEYITRCNPMVQFISTHIVKSPDAMLTIFRAYEAYKEWMRNTSPSKQIPSMHTFIDDMRSNGYETVNNFFCGITLAQAM
jgi:phage/plasmid-associated DNA primase